MSDWETDDLFGLWEQLEEQTTSANVGAFVAPLPGPLRPPTLTPVPAPQPGTTVAPGYESVCAYLERRRR